MALRGKALVDNLLSAVNEEDRAFLICISIDLLQEEPVETKKYVVTRLLQYLGTATEDEIAAIVGVIEEFLPAVRNCADMCEVLEQYLSEFEFALLKIRKSRLQGRIDRVARDIGESSAQRLGMLCYC